MDGTSVALKSLFNFPVESEKSSPTEDQHAFSWPLYRVVAALHLQFAWGQPYAYVFPNKGPKILFVQFYLKFPHVDPYYTFLKCRDLLCMLLTQPCKAYRHDTPSNLYRLLFCLAVCLSVQRIASDN